MASTRPPQSIPGDEISAPHAARLLDVAIPDVLQLLRAGTLPGQRDRRRGWLTTMTAVRQYQARSTHTHEE
ncbi:MAG: hypothetical protein KKA73_01645 [Chloroflexi bacterium]|nr:hypothetical protein [Chloroflexota bacterium]MBU1746368.1 hypothetical protein [Chloroflexota bacterium]